ncbi:MAG: hypothetical protein Q6365_018915, partial [Candidatus Sigynarchaeota archaeon]
MPGKSKRKRGTVTGLVLLFLFNGILVASAIQCLIQGNFVPSTMSGAQVISGVIPPRYSFYISIFPTVVPRRSIRPSESTRPCARQSPSIDSRISS